MEDFYIAGAIFIMIVVALIIHLVERDDLDCEDDEW